MKTNTPSCLHNRGSRFSRILLALSWIILTAAPIWAETFRVTNTLDDGSPGTLRWAINQANTSPHSTIQFNVNLGTIALTTFLPPITASVTIEGAIGNTISGEHQHRIFFVDAPGPTVTIRNLSLVNGTARGGEGGAGGGGGGLGAGGAIFVNSGWVTVQNVSFNGNQAIGGAGGSGTNGSGQSNGGGGGGGLGGNGGNGSNSVGGGGGGGFMGNGGSAQDGGAGGGGGFTGHGGAGSVYYGNYSGGGGGGLGVNGRDAVGQVGGSGGGGGGSGAGSFDGSNPENGQMYGGGGGGGYSSTTNGGNGGKFGGGGGASRREGSTPAVHAGNGGDFGGGGGYNNADGSNSAGDGGFGGGGGGGASISELGHSSSAGSGGFGGGGGGTYFPAQKGAGGFLGGDGGATRYYSLYTSGGAGGGGGGGAAGAAIFVRPDNGATLTIIDGEFDAGTVVAGAGGYTSMPFIHGDGAKAGTATGGALFLPNGTTTVQTNGNLQIAGQISGYGTYGIVKTGAGTLTLTGENNFADGSATISAGTLAVGDGGTSGSLAGNIINNGALVFNRSDDVIYSDVISGGGTLTKQGGGTLTLNGVQTYSGATTVQGGFLRIESGSLASSAVNLSSASFLLANSTGAMSANVTGSGTFARGGAGRSMLTGTVSSGVLTRVDSGTLQIGNGGATGHIEGNVENEGTLSVNRTDAYTYTGAISGHGTVLQAGSGTTTFSGSNTYTGDTIVDAGHLRVDGSIAGAVVVRDGATLGGNGVIQGAVTVENGGTLSPGNSPGLLTLEGDLTFSEMSVLRMEFAARSFGFYDQIDVQGFFTAAGILNLVIVDGYNPEQGDTFTIFTGADPGYDAGSFTIMTNLADGLRWDASRLASDGIVQVVPEPSTYALLALGALALFLKHRRRARV